MEAFLPEGLSPAEKEMIEDGLDGARHSPQVIAYLTSILLNPE